MYSYDISVMKVLASMCDDLELNPLDVVIIGLINIVNLLGKEETCLVVKELLRVVEEEDYEVLQTGLD